MNTLEKNHLEKNEIKIEKTVKINVKMHVNKTPLARKQTFVQRFLDLH